MLTLEQQKEIIFLITVRDEAERMLRERPEDEELIRQHTLAVIALYKYLDELVVKPYF